MPAALAPPPPAAKPAPKADIPVTQPSTAPPDKKETDALSASFDELDKLNFDDKNKWVTPKPAEKKEVKPPEKPVEKPAETPATKPEPEAKPTDQPPEEEMPRTNPGLRKAYEESKKTLKAKSEEITKLKTELEQSKTKGPDDGYIRFWSGHGSGFGRWRWWC